MPTTLKQTWSFITTSKTSVNYSLRTAHLWGTSALLKVLKNKEKFDSILRWIRCILKI